MKFTAGYLLGAGTVVGLLGSFMGGVIAWELVNEKKNEAAKSASDKVTDATVGSMMASYLNRTKN
jgi:hypothetical protein